MTESGVVRQVDFKSYRFVSISVLTYLLFVKFVAMPLGQGYTVEEQITGKAEHGGLQIDVFPKRETPPGSFKVTGSNGYERFFPVHMTPADLSVPTGTQIQFEVYVLPLFSR
jgi:hypothetical protein